MRTLPLVVVLSLYACTSATDATDPTPRVVHLEALTPTSFSATVGTHVAPVPRVRVLDESGGPVQGFPVTFTASEGTVAGANARTDASGTAAVVSWVLAPWRGSQQLTARAGAAVVVFTASALPGPLTSLDGRFSRSPYGGVGTTVQLVALGTDTFGNAVEGAEVSFTVASGGGRVSPSTALLGSDGTSTVSWTLGPAAGEQQVLAEAGGVRAVITAEACEQCPQLLFVRAGQIHRIDLATGEERQLTSTGWNTSPAWSPDGQRIAFAHYDQEVDPSDPERFVVDTSTAGIYLMDADGTNLVRRIPGSIGARRPTMSWSPDGASLAFDGGRLCSGSCSVRVIDVGSPGAPRTIASVGLEPAWSPDGTRIAYVSWAGNEDVAKWSVLDVTSADGANTTTLVPWSGASIEHPSWSPDGKRIVFVRDGDLMTVASDGGLVAWLTQDPEAPWTPKSAPAWSPDGRLIAFEQEDEILYISPAGGAPKPLVFPGSDPAWRP